MILDDYTDVDTSSLSDTIDSESGSIPLLYPSEIIRSFASNQILVYVGYLARPRKTILEKYHSYWPFQLLTTKPSKKIEETTEV